MLQTYIEYFAKVTLYYFRFLMLCSVCLNFIFNTVVWLEVFNLWKISILLQIVTTVYVLLYSYYLLFGTVLLLEYSLFYIALVLTYCIYVFLANGTVFITFYIVIFLIMLATYLVTK